MLSSPLKFSNVQFFLKFIYLLIVIFADNALVELFAIGFLMDWATLIVRSLELELRKLDFILFRDVLAYKAAVNSNCMLRLFLVYISVFVVGLLFLRLALFPLPINRTCTYIYSCLSDPDSSAIWQNKGSLHKLYPNLVIFFFFESSTTFHECTLGF